MTKADIVDKVAIGTGLTKLETEAIIEGFFKTVIDALRDGKVSKLEDLELIK